MKINVEFCNGGNNKFYFRLIFKNGKREFVNSESWNRKTASKALDLLQNVYGLKRKSIKFNHLN